jgi:hypothetical protein
LDKDFIRNGTRRIIGGVTTAYSDRSAVARNEGNRITGRTGDRFHATRDSHGICYRSTPPIQVS